MDEYKGHWALVTGASSGIGEEFAKQLASHGVNLVMTARDETALHRLAEELATAHAIEARVYAMDLTHLDSIAALQEKLATAKIRIRILVNNAAFGRWGQFEGTEVETYQQMIALNVTAVVSLCHKFLPDLSTFPTSVLINLSSPAAYQPVPYMAVYAASKAFVHSFSQALFGEWQERGVLVQTLVPGPTRSAFDERAGAYKSALSEKRDSPAVAVKAALRHLADGRPVVTTARGTVKQRLFASLAPPKIVIREVAKMFRPGKV